MPSNVVENDLYTTPVVVPNNAEAADQASILLSVQPLVNRSAHHENDINFIAFPGARAQLSDGIIRVATTASIATLKAFVGSVGLDGNCRWVDANKTLYRYVSGDVTAENLPWVVAANNTIGRWRAVLDGVRDVANGIPTLNAQAKVAALKVQNGNIGNNFATDGDGETPTQISLITSTVYVDITGFAWGTTLAVLPSPTVAGDIIEVECNLYAAIINGPAGISEARIRMQLTDLSAPNTLTLDIATLIRLDNTTEEETRRPVKLRRYFVVGAGGPNGEGPGFLIRLQGRTLAAGGRQLQIWEPAKLSVRVWRP